MSRDLERSIWEKAETKKQSDEASSSAGKVFAEKINIITVLTGIVDFLNNFFNPQVYNETEGAIWFQDQVKKLAERPIAQLIAEKYGQSKSYRTNFRLESRIEGKYFIITVDYYYGDSSVNFITALFDDQYHRLRIHQREGKYDNYSSECNIKSPEECLQWLFGFICKCIDDL
jgi:hypothetical protein